MTFTALTETDGGESERFYVSKLDGKMRLYRRYLDEDGRWRNQVLPASKDDLTTAEGVQKAKARWRRELVEYPCHWCGKPIEMTRDELRFFTITMLKRYKIGALPTCSKECAEALVERYEAENGKVRIQ